MVNDIIKDPEMSGSLEDYVRQITKLPTISVIAREILGLVDNNKVSVEKL